ncbi:cysteine hydrolase family protein [Nocardia carnea]|uniref:cysteine hydrolase family protein n=1 Tax=Nocardia carnea TaxID=37328 RepID=UPI002458ADF6|nr:isochorismatase family protein [Nocardia carnea]
MTLSVLDPRTALLAVDLQKGVAAMPLVHPAAEVAANAGRLAEAFRSAPLPVVIVRAAGMAPGRTEHSFRRSGDSRPPADAADLVPEFGSHTQDHTVVKRTWGSFTATDLDQYLRRQGVTQVVLTGIATSFAVESTARQAYELGYNVTLAVDAMTDFSLEAHTHSLTRVFPALGETGTTDEIIELLGAQ